MCPLRFILIFLSATLAGFFLLRNLHSNPDLDSSAAAAPDDIDDQSDVFNKENDSSISPPPLRSKVYQAVGKGFWMFVDMASGRYLWRNIVAVDSSSSSSAFRSKKL